MILYILLGLLAVVIIQLGMAISTLSKIQMLSRDILLSRPSEFEREDLRKVLKELEKQSLHLGSIMGSVADLNSPLAQYKNQREFDDYIRNVDLDDILK